MEALRAEPPSDLLQIHRQAGHCHTSTTIRGRNVNNVRFESIMGVLTVSQARENLREVIDCTKRSGEPVVLTRHGRPVAVVLDHALFERLVAAADDTSDRQVLALARTDVDTVPWVQVTADLGLL